MPQTCCHRNRTVPCMLLWKHSGKLRNFVGQPITGRILKRASLLTRSKASVTSIKAMKRACCCSLHFSCSCLTEKVISTVERLDRKPHFLQAAKGDEVPHGKELASDPKERDAPIIVAVTAVTIVLVQGCDERISHLLGNCSLFPAFAQQLIKHNVKLVTTTFKDLCRYAI